MASTWYEDIIIELSRGNNQAINSIGKMPNYMQDMFLNYFNDVIGEQVGQKASSVGDCVRLMKSPKMANIGILDRNGLQKLQKDYQKQLKQEQEAIKKAVPKGLQTKPYKTPSQQNKTSVTQFTYGNIEDVISGKIKPKEGQLFAVDMRLNDDAVIKNGKITRLHDKTFVGKNKAWLDKAIPEKNRYTASSFISKLYPYKGSNASAAQYGTLLHRMMKDFAQGTKIQIGNKQVQLKLDANGQLSRANLSSYLNALQQSKEAANIADSAYLKTLSTKIGKGGTASAFDKGIDSLLKSFNYTIGALKSKHIDPKSATETSYGMVTMINGELYAIQGTIDMLAQIEAMGKTYLEVVDYKTSSQLGPQYNIQAAIYNALIKAHQKLEKQLNPGLKNIAEVGNQVSFIHVPKKGGKYETVSTPVMSDADLSQIMKNVVTIDNLEATGVKETNSTIKKLVEESKNLTEKVGLGSQTTFERQINKKGIASNLINGKTIGNWLTTYKKQNLSSSDIASNLDRMIQKLPQEAKQHVQNLFFMRGKNGQWLYNDATRSQDASGKVTIERGVYDLLRNKYRPGRLFYDLNNPKFNNPNYFGSQEWIKDTGGAYHEADVNIAKEHRSPNLLGEGTFRDWINLYNSMSTPEGKQRVLNAFTTTLEWSSSPMEGQRDKAGKQRLADTKYYLGGVSSFLSYYDEWLGKNQNLQSQFTSAKASYLKEHTGEFSPRAFSQWLDSQDGGDKLNEYYRNQEDYAVGKIFENALFSNTSRAKSLYNARITGEFSDDSYRYSDDEIVLPESDQQIIDEYETAGEKFAKERDQEYRNSLQRANLKNPKARAQAINSLAYRIVGLTTRKDLIEKARETIIDAATKKYKLSPDKQQFWRDTIVPRINPELTKDERASNLFTDYLINLYKNPDTILEDLYSGIHNNLKPGQIAGESSLLGYKELSYGNVFQLVSDLVENGVTSQTKINIPGQYDQYGNPIQTTISDLIGGLLGQKNIPGVNDLASSRIHKLKYAGIIAGFHPYSGVRLGEVKDGKYLPFNEAQVNKVTQNYRRELRSLPTFKQYSTHLLLKNRPNYINGGASSGMSAKEIADLEKNINNNVLLSSNLANDPAFEQALLQEFDTWANDRSSRVYSYADKRGIEVDDKYLSDRVNIKRFFFFFSFQDFLKTSDFNKKYTQYQISQAEYLRLLPSLYKDVQAMEALSVAMGYQEPGDITQMLEEASQGATNITDIEEAPAVIDATTTKPKRARRTRTRKTKTSGTDNSITTTEKVSKIEAGSMTIGTSASTPITAKALTINNTAPITINSTETTVGPNPTVNNINNNFSGGGAGDGGAGGGGGDGQGPKTPTQPASKEDAVNDALNEVQQKSQKELEKELKQKRASYSKQYENLLKQTYAEEERNAKLNQDLLNTDSYKNPLLSAELARQIGATSGYNYPERQEQLKKLREQLREVLSEDEVKSIEDRLGGPHQMRLDDIAKRTSQLQDILPQRYYNRYVQLQNNIAKEQYEKNRRQLYNKRSPLDRMENTLLDEQSDMKIAEWQKELDGRDWEKLVGGAEAYARANQEVANSTNLLRVQQDKLSKYLNPTIWDNLKSSVQGYLAQLKNGSLMWMFVAYMRRGFQQIIQGAQELDKAMTNLRVVLGDSREDVRNLMTDYSELGQQLSATTTEVANAANEWLRQGYSIAETNDLISASLHLSKLGMIDSGQATEYLTSMLKGFKLEASDAMEVVDKLTKVD